MVSSLKDDRGGDTVELDWRKKHEFVRYIHPQLSEFFHRCQPVHPHPIVRSVKVVEYLPLESIVEILLRIPARQQRWLIELSVICPMRPSHSSVVSFALAQQSTKSPPALPPRAGGVLLFLPLDTISWQSDSPPQFDKDSRRLYTCSKTVPGTRSEASPRPATVARGKAWNGAPVR